MTDDAGILELLIDHELAVKHLYEAYASVFEERQPFWQDLARAEQGHADKLEQLRSEPSAHRWLAVDSGIRPQAVRSSITYVEDQADRARKGGMSLLQALSIARDLEDALIERQLFRVKDSGCAALDTVFERLAGETAEHARLLGAALEAERRLHL